MEHSENRDVDVDVVDTPTHDCRPAVVEDAAPAACPAQKDEGDWGGPAHMYSIYTCGAARFVPVVVASSATPSSLAVSSMAPAPSSPFFLSPPAPAPTRVSGAVFLLSVWYPDDDDASGRIPDQVLE
jgi:hypothetical protein